MQVSKEAECPTLTIHLSENVHELINRAGVPANKLSGAGVQGGGVTTHLSENVHELINRARVPANNLSGAGVQGGRVSHPHHSPF